MLHSSLSSKSQWTALAERLSARFRVIALDLCGYGDNAPASAESHSIDDEVRLVTSHLDRLLPPLSRVHVVGHSFGALVSLRLAHLHPARVASLSLYEPVAFRLLPDDDASLVAIRAVAERVMRLVDAGKRHDAASAFIDLWNGDGAFSALPLPAQASLARRMDKVPLDFRAAWRWQSTRTDCAAIAAPALLMAGTRSPVAVRNIARILGGVLRDVRTWHFDAGHMAPITHAERINECIDAFVSERAQLDTAPDATNRSRCVRR